ncbi:hypothetical protein P691DRAFT_691292 [Macrolepiota fuliginosa MF-IS2]|uniref:Uncharacterized protein n=1 Tax=Macrolepiota fuliginosa MF-IS2 TaxID=1400762 RepID=A0A9P6C7P0_9AGAR|nr:hypothetical protein P691DRAFT_691292 [Macrolepiota fuliginosa MF-IS2]
MDDLVHYCLRELSFDGDLGSNISRLKDFIVDFYTHPETSHVQNSDDAFCAFVWSIVVQQPTVRVGTIPEDIKSEVWIAPQTSKKKKAKEKGEEHEETKPPELHLIPDAITRSLESLVEEFGDRLRIAVEPNAIYAAITGSHIRFAKLSPMVYTALQLITRGRYDGVSVVALGKQSGYDQKTCFYLIKQLQELDLVVKVPKPGVGTNFAIHRYFFDKSPHWKAIREEEHKAEEEDKILRQPNEEPLEEEAMGEKPTLDFTPIDARHLSSLPLVKSRVVKLLKASKNYIHESNNMLITLGFSKPTKTDRRFFQSRIKELIQQGVIEKVVVPSSRRKSSKSLVKCFRLVTSENKPEGVDLDPQDDDETEEEEKAELAKEVSEVKMNVTIHKQILDLLEESGTRGMTLSDLSNALCHFDKRTIELLLARADRVPPPPHLSDLGIAGLMETSGRERRHRYYTVAAYCKLIAEEKLDPSSTGYGAVDFTNVGEFATIDSGIFYKDGAALIEYQDAYKADVVVATAKTKKKRPPPKNPVLPDGSIKLGRPRKQPQKDIEGDDQQPKSGRKRKANSSIPGSSAKKRRVEEDRAQTDLTVSKRRGRPPKNKATPEEHTSVPGAISNDVENDAASISQVAPKPKKRLTVADTADSSPRRSKRKKHSEKDDVDPFRVGDSIASLRFGHQEDLPETVPTSATEEAQAGPTEPSISGEEDERRILQTEPITQPADTGSPMWVEAVAREEATVPIDPALMQDLLESQSITSPALPLDFDAKSMADKSKPTNARSRVNVSNLRREGEMYRVIESFGGIINTQSKEFSNAHATLLETLSKAGEPTSAPPGTKTDKRTATAALDSLEARGKIKQLRTSVQTHTGANRPARIAYLPHVTETRLKDYLVELSKTLQPAPQTASFLKIDERVEYGADPTSISRSSLPLQLLQMERPGSATDKKERWSKNMARANQLFTYDDETIREVLLAERTTLGQLYGFIVGKMARIRELHLLALRAFEGTQLLASVVSKEHKIIDVSFFCYDLPLTQYCSLISCLAHSQELWDFYSTEAGRKTPVRDLPPDLHSFMQIGRSRARSRVLELLEVLRPLGVATPVQPSESETPWLVCEANANHPTKFDRAPLEGWSTSTPMAAPSFWKLNDVAPVHAWRESETSPSFWKDMAIDTVVTALQFWDTLRTASIETPICADGELSIMEHHSATSVHVSLARSLRRAGSWNTQYFLTWHQMQYLRQFIRIHSAETPLEETDEGARDQLMERVCRVTSASRDAIVGFYREMRERLLRELNKARQKEKRSLGIEKRVRRAAEVKELLAKKAAEARRKREQEWDALLLQVHPDPLSSAASGRVKRVQKRFLEAGSTQETEKWEGDIMGAIREADMAKAFKMSNKPPMVPPPLPTLLPPPPLVLNPLEPSVQSLIERQGTPLEPKEPLKKRRRGKNKAPEGGAAEPSSKVSRRHRFQWSRDYDELARDAAAIIRARCRNVARVDWAAFEQVFPAVPRNTVRQRLAHIREAPGNEAYMNRLEEKWYELWVQHRGTPLLPDDDPQSTSKFELAKHIEFLRKHIDKNALRVGYGHTRESGTVTIPSTVEELLDEYEIDSTESPGMTWDFMWNANVEEGREKRLMRQAFTQAIEETPLSNDTPSDWIALAEAALKMTLGTPSERYDAAQGALILQSVGQRNVEAAAKAMISRGVLSKLTRDPQKLKPGRHLKISDMNLNAIGGSVSRDTFQDAVALEELVAQDDIWREWPLTATDGDCAALIELVMENKLDFKIDTTQAQAARVTLDWNSKKADDDQIETSIFYRRTVPSVQIHLETETVASPDEVMAELNAEPTLDHELTDHEKPASCRLTGGDSNLVDCANCLGKELVALKERSSSEHQELVSKVLEIVQNTGKDGITLPVLQIIAGLSTDNLLQTVQELERTSVPLVYRTGYSSSVLVSAPFIKYWSIKISESPVQRVFPRRWLDTEGRKIGEYWEAALKAVLGLVIFRPGISQTEIRWRLRSTYDRQEVHEITRLLLTEGFLKVQIHPELGVSQDAAILSNDDEERRTFYFIGDRRWYQA